MKPTHRSPATGAILVVLAVAAAYWLWYGLTQRSIIDDEGISILAAESILEHGYSLLPSGMIYNRAHLAHYMLAGSMAIFGTNGLGIMLPSLLLGLGSLYLTYRLGRDVFDRPLTGAVLAAILAFLPVQTFYATGPRMYMTLQFFTVLATYGTWRGFIVGEPRFRWIVALAIAGGIFTHQEGGAALVALPLAILFVRWLQGERRTAIRTAPVIAGLIVLYAAFFLQTIYDFPQQLHGIAVHAGQDPNSAGINLHPGQWLEQIDVLESVVPFGLAIVPLVVAFALGSLRKRDRVASGWIFMTIALLLFVVALLSNVKVARPRLWMFVLPLYVVLLGISLVAFFDWLGSAGAGQQWHGVSRRRLACSALAGWVLTLLVAYGAVYGPAATAGRIKHALRRPCRTGICSRSIGEQYASFRDEVRAADVVVSSNPWVTNYYLGRVDGFLRERIEDGVFQPFDQPTDEYFGIPLIDSGEKLRELEASTRRVWIVADYKLQRFSSRQTREFLNADFPKFLEHESLTVFVNPGAVPAGE